MNWFSIMDSKSAKTVGILLESGSGQIIAALEGNMDDSDSCFRVLSEIMKSGVVKFVARDGLQIVSRSVSSGDVGYAAALAHAVQPPLVPGASGEVKKVGSPADMVNRIWIALGEDGPPPPLMGHGGGQTQRVNNQMNDLYPDR